MCCYFGLRWPCTNPCFFMRLAVKRGLHIRNDSACTYLGSNMYKIVFGVFLVAVPMKVLCTETWPKPCWALKYGRPAVHKCALSIAIADEIQHQGLCINSCNIGLR